MADGGAVVVGVDGTEVSGHAAQWAARQAAALGRTLVLVYALRTPVYTHTYLAMPVDITEDEAMRDWARRMLEGVAERCRELGAEDVRTEVVAGEPAEAVMLAAERPEFVVVGHSDTGGVARFLLGSTAERLARSCQWPVVVIREGVSSDDRPGPVVVGVDDSAESARAVRFAVEFASYRDAEVVAVHATMAHEHEPVAVDVEVRRASGDPVEALLLAAADARLLVVGSHGKGMVRRAFGGSVSHDVVDRAPCPVAVLPPETAR